MTIPKDYLAKCKKDIQWCHKLSVKLGKLSMPELVKLNCGKKIKPLCRAEKEKIILSCLDDPKERKDTPKWIACYHTKVVLRTMTGCAGGKRAGKIGADKSDSTGLYLGIGALLLILIVGAIAAYFYLFGGKKDGKAAKGASKSKSKMAGKSKIGSRKSQASKRSSRKGSQRSKVSGASKGKGTKSRVSSKKK